jgi:hypothetical protein
MEMLQSALEQPNPFPAGLFWTITRRSDIPSRVSTFIERAKHKNVRAALAEIGTSDVLMTRIWRQLPMVDGALDDKVRSKHATKVSIPLPNIGTQYPVLRTNALPITSLPQRCGQLTCSRALILDEVRAAQGTTIPEAAYVLESGLLFWGATSEVEKWIPPEDIVAKTVRDFHDPLAAITESTVLRSLFEHGLAKALCTNRPVVLRRKGRDLFVVASTQGTHAQALAGLSSALTFTGKGKMPISGTLPKINATWAEAVSIHLEARNGTPYLLLEPEIWISPLSKREDATEFIKARTLKRYNQQSYRILDAWIEILLGRVPGGEDATLTAFVADDHSATFKVCSRTAYSGKSDLDA